MSMTTIVLVDDHHLVRQGLQALLETEPDFSFIGEAGDGLEALRLVEALNPNVLIVDLMMPGLGIWAGKNSMSRQASASP